MVLIRSIHEKGYCSSSQQQQRRKKRRLLVRSSMMKGPSSSSRRRYSILLCICIFLYICTVSRTYTLRGLEEKSGGEEEERPSEVKCFAYSECVICPKSGNREGCDGTNRRQTYHCHVAGKEDTTSSTKSSSQTTTTTYSEFRSCQRTVSDESRLLFRFQMVCLLTGIFSVMSMRKHKLSTASLFEQRRRKPVSSSSSSTSKDTIKYSSLPNHKNNERKDSSSSDVFPDSDTIISGVTTDV